MSKVSVILPVYNGEKYIIEAIESIKKQNRCCYEIIVVDDGSTDNTAALIESYIDVTLIRKVHSGINSTLNVGLDVCSGDFITFLDADDRWLEYKTERQLDILLNNADIDLVFGHCQRFEMINTSDGIKEQLLDTVPGVTRCGGMFRKEIFNEVGNFSETEGAHSFIDWFAKFQEKKGKMTIHTDIVFQRRIHEGNFGRLNKDMQRRQYFSTLKAALDRRRATTNC